MSKEGDVYNVAVAANERFMPGALMALSSLAVNARRESRLCFHVFTEDVLSATMDEMKAVLRRVHPNCEVLQYVCDEQLLAGLPYWAGSRMASVRIHFPYLLKDVDWCLYLDCDIAYLASVEEHFSLRDESKYAVVVPDESDEFCFPEVRRIHERCGVDVPREKYFNSGVMLFNFAKCRQDGIPDRLLEFFKTNADSKLPDQTAYNVVFNGLTVIAPGKFNRLLPHLTVEKLRERPVLHYISGKPWTKTYGEVVNSRFRFWHAYADKYLWQKKGESCRRCFSWRMLIVKKVLFEVLRMPIVGGAFAKLMGIVGLVKGDGCSWRKKQIIPELETREAKVAMAALIAGTQ